MALFTTIFQAVFRKGLLVGGLLLLGIVIAELLLWTLAPVSPYAVYKYQFTNEMKPFGLSETSTFEVDARELRKRPGTDGREESLKMLILGGEGNYQPLQNAGETWWGRLAQEMENQFPEMALEVATKASPAGAGQGTSLSRSLAWAKTYMEEIDPDIVVASFGVSEVLDIAPGYRYNPTKMQMLPALPRAGRVRDKVVNASQLARRLRLWRTERSESANERQHLLEQPNHFLNLLQRRRQVYESLRFDARPPRHAEDQDPKLEYLDGLRTIQALAKQNGAQLIVLGEPTLHHGFLGLEELERLNRPRWTKRPTVQDTNGAGLRPDPAWVEDELNRYYNAAESWAGRERVPFVNLNRTTALPKSTINFVDDTTLTNAGSQSVADEVAPAVAVAIKKVLAN